ncbi:MAG: thiamine-phosphate synthase family protein [Chloroflexota bacterium]
MMRYRQAELILGNLAAAVDMLERSHDFATLVPEVRVNIAYALPKASTPKQVAAVDGRITVVRGMPRASGPLVWGVSDHMARLILQARKYDPSINAGINFKCDEDIIKVVKQYAAEVSITFGWIDRTKEPPDIAGTDRSSMPWKVKYLVETYDVVPRLFFEGEGWGKEPLFVALGKDAVEVVKITLEIARRYHRLMKT